MTANKARFALTLSLALALAACGGGGGGGGGDDEPPPPGSGEFDGSFSLRSTNNNTQAFDRTVPAVFVNGSATVSGGATTFDYPVDPATGGCTYDGGLIEHCVERALGQVLVLCTSANAPKVGVVGIRNDAQATLTAVPLQELAAAAIPKSTQRLELQSLGCSGTLNTANSVSIGIDGSAIQRSGNQIEPLTRQQMELLFGSAGISANRPFPAQIGAKAYKHVLNNVTTYYVVNFGAPTGSAPSNSSLPPILFVSVN